ncbi:MAG: hypothetical protein ACREBS_04995 [Nitrososphaerales archaeon]
MPSHKELRRDEEEEERTVILTTLEEERAQEIEDRRQGKIKKEEQDRANKSKQGLSCEFCGIEFQKLGVNSRVREGKQFCSSKCSSKLSNRRIQARLALTPTKRQAMRLRFSSPLYFN